MHVPHCSRTCVCHPLAHPLAHPLRAHCSWILQLSFEQELYSGGNDTRIHTWSPALPHQEPEADLPPASGREEQDTWSDDGY